MKPRHLLSIADLSPQEIQHILHRAAELKKGAESTSLAGKSVALLFEKPSLRTKASFDLAVHQLGGRPIYFGADEVGLGKREPVADVARVLERYVDAIVARTVAHSTLTELARWASVPVVNALSDVEHPCQVLGDFLTIMEHKNRLQGLAIAYVGDGNNVAASLALGAALVGAHFAIASPPGYQLPTPVLAKAQELAAKSGGLINQMASPQEAVSEAQVVYTDVWTSMGQERETIQRQKAFANYQVNPDLIAKAGANAIFMHPLPAHQGEEVAQGMLEHAQSVVFDQAENRLHAQKGLLDLLLGHGAY